LRLLRTLFRSFVVPLPFTLAHLPLRVYVVTVITGTLIVPFERYLPVVDCCCYVVGCTFVVVVAVVTRIPIVR